MAQCCAVIYPSRLHYQQSPFLVLPPSPQTATLPGALGFRNLLLHSAAVPERLQQPQPHHTAHNPATMAKNHVHIFAQEVESFRLLSPVSPSINDASCRFRVYGNCVAGSVGQSPSRIRERFILAWRCHRSHAPGTPAQIKLNNWAGLGIWTGWLATSASGGKKRPPRAESGQTFFGKPAGRQKIF